ncbi:MAG: hypothetical protein OXH67_14400 [Acidimicrobiaceae bacterium]|nr:hypothetical protein [Acidimicrobiaceae bacterium]
MPAADWQPDPTGRHETRRRNPDGTWSDQVSDYGVLGRDAYDGEQPEPIPLPEPEHDQPSAPPSEPVAQSPSGPLRRSPSSSC